MALHQAHGKSHREGFLPLQFSLKFLFHCCPSHNRREGVPETAKFISSVSRKSSGLALLKGFQMYVSLIRYNDYSVRPWTPSGSISLKETSLEMGRLLGDNQNNDICIQVQKVSPCKTRLVSRKVMDVQCVHSQELLVVAVACGELLPRRATRLDRVQ